MNFIKKLQIKKLQLTPKFDLSLANFYFIIEKQKSFAASHWVYCFLMQPKIKIVIEF